MLSWDYKIFLHKSCIPVQSKLKANEAQEKYIVSAQKWEFFQISIHTSYSH